MQYFPAKLNNQNALSVIVCINPNTTNNLGGAEKVIINPILSGWKPRWVNHTLTSLNASIFEATINLTLIFALSRNINLITNSI